MLKNKGFTVVEILYSILISSLLLLIIISMLNKSSVNISQEKDDFEIKNKIINEYREILSGIMFAKKINIVNENNLSGIEYINSNNIKISYIFDSDTVYKKYGDNYSIIYEGGSKIYNEFNIIYLEDNGVKFNYEYETLGLKWDFVVYPRQLGVFESD